MAMPSRGLTFHQEIHDAIATRERLVLVDGPKVSVSDSRAVRIVADEEFPQSHPYFGTLIKRPLSETRLHFNG